jgi:CheY-like chemotaxis protein
MKETALQQPTVERKAKVAVIDDDRFIRYLLDMHLRNAGYEVFVAEDAVVGGRIVLERFPDVIVCDVDMPYMSGCEFAEALRSDPATCHIPVIFLTVHANDARARELGVACLQKPVTADELVRALERFSAPQRQPAS